MCASSPWTPSRPTAALSPPQSWRWTRPGSQPCVYTAGNTQRRDTWLSQERIIQLSAQLAASHQSLELFFRLYRLQPDYKTTALKNSEEQLDLYMSLQPEKSTSFLKVTVRLMRSSVAVTPRRESRNLKKKERLWLHCISLWCQTVEVYGRWWRNTRKPNISTSYDFWWRNGSRQWKNTSESRSASDFLAQGYIIRVNINTFQRKLKSIYSVCLLCSVITCKALWMHSNLLWGAI